MTLWTTRIAKQAQICLRDSKEILKDLIEASLSNTNWIPYMKLMIPNHIREYIKASSTFTMSSLKAKILLSRLHNLVIII